MQETPWERRFASRETIDVEPLRLRDRPVASIRDLREEHRADAGKASTSAVRNFRIAVGALVAAFVLHGAFVVIGLAIAVIFGTRALLGFERARFHRIAAITMPELDD